jgi:tRNA threonylcarbamoyladenosine biosynthesis protein TsaB
VFVKVILNIDTSMETASVALAADGKVISRSVNEDQKGHASWLHTAIAALTEKAGIKLSELAAIGVTAGPGSYTGIRVGLAAAKGLAYALDIPLVALNTLRVMAWSQAELNSMRPDADSDPHQRQENNPAFRADLQQVAYCPMIDARRDEVFTAIYDANMQNLLAPAALSLTSGAFSAILAERPVLFFGSGSDKWKALCESENAAFQKWDYAYFNLAYLSFQEYQNGRFADLAYIQPDYLKEFFTYKKK